MTTATPRIILWGTPSFTVPSLRALHEANMIVAVVTRPDRTQGRGCTLVIPSAVKQFAMEHAIPVLQPAALDDSFVVAMQPYLPATFVVIAYGELIPDAVLKLSEKIAINIHPSLLPDLRGPSPIQTAILKGYQKTGVTLMQLDAKMDHGPILAQRRVTIVPRDTYTTLNEKLSLVAVRVVTKYVPLYMSGAIEPTVQDHTKATFSRLIKPEDGRLDLGLSAEVLGNRIRALNPWPGTSVDLKGFHVKIVQSIVHTQGSLDRSFVELPNHRLGIRCNSGYLEVLTVQPAGKKPMSAESFLNGYRKVILGS